jgi:hypothetical protein
MAKGPLNDDQLQEHQANGFVLVRRMFDEEETGLLRRAAKEDRELDQHSDGRGDGEGGTVRLSLWNHPGDTLYGMFARSESIVNSAEKLLGGEVYHYHSKRIMKDPKVGAPGRGTRTTDTGIKTVFCFRCSAARPSPWTQPRGRTVACKLFAARTNSAASITS